MNHLLLRGKCSGNKRLTGPYRELDTHRERLWTSTDVEAIEPTNNTADRALPSSIASCHSVLRANLAPDSSNACSQFAKPAASKTPYLPIPIGL